MARLTYKLVISGFVQGVSFRASMRFIALQLGIDGWVRNREDGAVEALVQGDEAIVEKVLEWARTGPPGAQVISFEKQRLENYPAQKGFHVLF